MSRSNAKRKQTVGSRDSAFSFSEGSRVLYATILAEKSDPLAPIMNLATAKVVKCAIPRGKKETHVNLERNELAFWVPYSDVYQILHEDKDPYRSLEYL